MAHDTAIWHAEEHGCLSRIKQFFFEKKNQKTSAPLRAVLKPPAAKIKKVFLLLFVHKKKCFLSLPSFEVDMLELRPSCECCDRALPPESAEARICSYECTFCADCVATVLGGVCPNCGGGFAARPIRPAWMLAKHPASTVRVWDADCAKRLAKPA